MFDVIVIGGGPGGYKTAELLGENGLKAALVEEEDLGGTCLNQGCIPFKSYLHTSRIRQETLKACGMGLTGTTAVGISQREVLDYKESIVKGLRKSVEGALKHRGVSIYRGHARVIRHQDNAIVIDVNGESVEGAKLVIATGSEDKNIDIPTGLSYKVINSKEMLQLDYLPDEIEIIGAGAIGLEAASYFADAGCHVTVMESMDHIGGHIDREISQAMERILGKKGVSVITGATLHHFEADRIVYQKDREWLVRQPKVVLLATGRVPRMDYDSLDVLNVKYSDKGIEVDDQCKTSTPDIYACGDVTGKLMLAHTAYRQAKVIAGSICGEESRMEYSSIPRMIYTNPEVMSVGYSEEDCLKLGTVYTAKSLPMTYSGKYFAEIGKDGAVAKMIADTEGRVIGFHMIGNGACEISLAVEIMIKKGMAVGEIKDLVFAHPTYSEIIYELAGRFV